MNAQQWIANALSPQFGAIQRIETIKKRPWSVVLRITAEQGVSYFKSCGSGGKHETHLLLWLEQVCAEMIPTVIAISSSQGWILMADAGIGLRDLPGTEDRIKCLEKLLPHYAEVQQRSIGLVEELTQMQLPGRQVEKLPLLLRDLVKTWSDLGTIDLELRSNVLNSMPTLERLCQSLAASRYAAALEHGDLHAGNVLVREGMSRICDWGDSCITHPFCSLLPMLNPLISGEAVFEFTVSAQRLIDAYLEPWTSLAPIDILQTEFKQALWVSHILRALDIAHMLNGADESSLSRWSPSIAEYLSRWVRIEKTIRAARSPNL